MSYPEWLHILAWSWLVSAALSALIIIWDIRHGHPQAMAIMTVAWPVNALYFGVLGLIAYFWFGRGHPGDHCDMAMPMAGYESMTMSMDKPMAGQASIKRAPASWQSIFKTSTHCGTGCTLADIVGEGWVILMPVTLLGSSLLGAWTLDFILALCLGIFFQYWPARQMGMSRWLALKNAVKADVLSLTCWQLGMYAWMAIALFLLFTPDMPHVSALYWFMMQIAMIVGFCSAYPMNKWLVSKGIKHAM